MSADFILKQNLKLSLEGQVKNLVPEILEEIPPESTWRLGRVWYNKSNDHFQGVFQKMDSLGNPINPIVLEVRNISNPGGGSEFIGVPSDGEYWPDGLIPMTENTRIADAMDEVNEILKELAPSEATMLQGDLLLLSANGVKSGFISNLNGSTLSSGTFTPGFLVNTILKDSTIVGTIPKIGKVVKGVQQKQFGKADQGIIKVIANGVELDDGVNLGNAFNEASRDFYEVIQGFDAPILQQVTKSDGTSEIISANPNKDSYKSSTDAIKITNVKQYNSFKKWQYGEGSINLGLTPGYNNFSVAHTVGGETFSTNTSEVFFDNSVTTPKLTLSNFELFSGDVKFVSGVPFLNKNIVFEIDIKAENIFDYTYFDKPISLIGSGTNLTDLLWNVSGSSLNSKSVPLWDDMFVLTNHKFNYSGTNTQLSSLSISGKVGKVVYGWTALQTLSKNILIDTFPASGNSTNLKETFNDENYRLKDDTNFDDFSEIYNKIGAWNSNDLLKSTDAQLFLGSLIRAKTNYNAQYNLNIDYSANSAIQFYYRPFYAQNKPNSNGTIKITTTYEIGEGKDIEIFMKLPGVTGWLDISKPFDGQFYNSNKLVDGTGNSIAIRKFASYTEVDWSIGLNSTVESNYLYVLKVILKNNASVSEIEEIAASWR